MTEDLNRIFNARAIAVIGASNDPSKRGNQAIRKLLADGYSGAIYPINPMPARGRATLPLRLSCQRGRRMKAAPF